MNHTERALLAALEMAQRAYLDVAYERAKELDVFAVAKAVERSNEAGRRWEKLKHNRFVS